MAADDCPKCEEGLPAWLATFADLMSLLMCFFVLLLSFAEIDAIRFKKMAESLKDAFGVQHEIPASEIVKGVSVIKQEWSPSVSEQSVITELRQETSPELKEHLKMQDGEGEGGLTEAELKAQAQAMIEAQLKDQLAELQDALEEEIDSGMVSVEKQEQKIILRIRERGSFRSGSASLDAGFQEVMDRIGAVLVERPGKIVVSGHTDNIPIRTGRFRSNWELSAARAVTVLHSLLKTEGLSEERVVVEGYADTHPLAPNDSAANRAVNRRVELVILRGQDIEGEPIPLGDQPAAEQREIPQ